MADHNVDALLSGEGVLAGNLSGAMLLAAALSGDGVLAGDLSGDVPLASDLSGDASFVADALNILYVDSGLAGEAALAADISGSVPDGAVFAGGSDFVIHLVVVPPAAPPTPVSSEGADSVAAGLATRYADNAMMPFRAETAWGTRQFYQALPGTIATIRTMGSFLLESYPMYTGSVRASIVAGASGGTVLELSDGPRQITIALDGTSRAGLILTDAAGSPVAQAAPWGAAIPAGATIDIQLSWNANTGQVTFLVNGQAPPVWADYPAGSWLPFLPAVAIVGPTGGYSIRQIQISKIPG